MFSREQIIKLKEQLDFRQYYRQYLELKQQGSLLWAKCCFHNDDSPSLSIDENTGIWKCWSENISGDCITFEQKIKGCSFTQAVINIAKSQDIKLEISPELKRELTIKKNLYGINNLTAKIYQKALVEHKEGQNYMLQRGFTIETIKAFQLGYIPKFKLASIGEKVIPVLRDAGLINVAEDGSIYNYFSTNRISIPFCDDNGNIVGFSSRAINNDIKPKYLHSRTNQIFKKDELLFGYHLAKQKIKETKSVILVEGQIDCIKAHQYGIQDCVAICGLALSEKHVKKLKCDVKNYYLVVEDCKGEQAIDKMYDTIFKESFYANVKIVKLYNGANEKCDLDEFLTKYGKGAFLEKIKTAPTYHEYKLLDSLKRVNYKTIEEKKFHIYNNRKYIAKITNPIDKKQYIELLAQKLELPENDVRKVIARAEQTDDGVVVGSYDDRRTTAQKYIISTFFSHFGVQKSYEVLKKLHIENKLDNNFKHVFKKLIDIILLYGACSDIINIAHSIETFTSDELSLLDDAYFKRDELEYLDEEEDLIAFLQDQLLNLR